MPVQKMCASTLCTSTAQACMYPEDSHTRTQSRTQAYPCACIHTHVFTHRMAFSIPGATGCICMSSSYKKSLVKRAEPFTHISVFLPPPIPICPQRHPSQEAGLETHNALQFREHTFFERFLSGDFTQLPIIC